MSITINVNSLSLCHKKSNGVSIATLPDVCKTPSPGGPVPIPYPNIALSANLAKGTTTVKADGGNMCAKYGSEFSRSTGDEPGTLGGVKSGTFMKEASWITYSFDVKLEGKGACRLTDKMFHNHQNTVNMAGEVQAMLAMAAREGDIYFLCYLLCQESLKPNPRQENIAKELDALDEASGGASPYKAEVPYNMRQSPPGHIPKDWTFPEYLKMRFYQPPKRRPEPLIQSWKDYKSGNVKDDIKIPDVSILNDPKQPPAGTNIRAVAEMKLRDDPTQFGTDTAKANERFYRRIATQDGTNPDGEYLALDAQTCGCAEGKPVLVPELQEANERLKKRVPQPAPAPVAEPSGGWLPTPSPAFVQGLSGVGQMLGGGVLMIGSGIAAGALVADDLTGIGVVDDALIPVAAAGAVGGAALFSNGAKMFMGAFGF